MAHTPSMAIASLELISFRLHVPAATVRGCGERRHPLPPVTSRVAQSIELISDIKVMFIVNP
jgi:hypothetical protein